VPDTPLQDKKTVLQILESFSGTGPLRELLANLNYDPLNEPVSRQDWPEPARAALAQDPRLYGRAAGEFYVIYAQLAADKLMLTQERGVVPQLLKQYPYALFVFSDKSQTNFHFVNVKWENTQKRRLYRRITVGPQERLRTAVERITLLDIQTIPAGLFGVKAQEIQDRHDLAFDVAKVTKDFYEEYKRVFEIMRDAIKGFGASDEEQDRRHLFAQRLFNRLMFLRFIQKKGWLTIDGSTDYLAALWASHVKMKQDGKNFYEDRLKFLFAALDNEQAGIVLQGKGGAVEATIGRVKYLNGGLFEKTAEDSDPKVRIVDAPFKQIFDKTSGLFEAFNFTITESTPLDVEIAVDPEMLGKIFEELVTGRHDSGSYYTPKPIVSFMCREALKGYLETQVSSEQKAAIERFVDKHEPDDIHNAEAVLNALRRVTVCDPACGSGAYLLGMMHELLDLRQCLFQTRHVDNKTMYQRKLDIIQTNIYGVDLAEFAVNIARLRLWLSLSVDFDGPAPEPLPNLDYKIEVGDSVCSPSPASLQMGLQQPLVDQFLELKKRYLVAHHADKQTLRTQVEGLRHSIMSFSSRDAGGFDWVVDFAEVFTDGGFDVVLANPPYVRHEKIKHLKADLKLRFPKEYSGTADLYCYFYLRAWEMLRDNGMISFISSNKWLRADYGGALRAKFAAIASVRSLTDFGELPVFETAATFPMIFVAQKNEPSAGDSFMFTPVKSLDAP
jgi:methylase of polypeptide subunit release factors